MGLTLPRERLVSGAGPPVTVAAHGLGASIAETRPLLSGVPGTRVLYSARGHGGSARPDDPRPDESRPDESRPDESRPDDPRPDESRPDEPYDYAALGSDLEQVADAAGATQALGVSMGAGALLSLLARRPDRFVRVVLFLPAAVDRPRSDEAVRRAAMLADVLDTGDAQAVQRAVLAELPADLRALPPAVAYARARAAHLRASPGVALALRSLPQIAPVEDASRLSSVRAEVLLLAQDGDPLHPAQVARDLAGLLPRARLVVFDRPGVVFRDRARLRALVSGFLTPPG